MSYNKNKERHLEVIRLYKIKNKDKILKMKRDYYHNNKEKFKGSYLKYGRKYLIKKRYGINEGEYQVLLDSQNGLCAICRVPQLGKHKFLSVDHNHLTGKVRGLLCNNCNHALGMVKDNPIILQKMINYLDKFNII